MAINMEIEPSEPSKRPFHREITTEAAKQIESTCLTTAKLLAELIAKINKSIHSQESKYRLLVEAHEARSEEIKKLRDAAKLREIEALSSDEESEDDTSTINANSALEKEKEQALDKLIAWNEKKLQKLQQTYNDNLLNYIQKALADLSALVPAHENMSSAHRNASNPEVISKSKTETDLKLLRQTIDSLNDEMGAKDIEIAKFKEQVKALSPQNSALQQGKKSASTVEKPDASATEDAELLAAANLKIVELEGILKLQGLLIINGDEYPVWGHPGENRDMIKQTNKDKNDATHRGNLRADSALSVLGIILKEELSRIYKFGGPFVLCTLRNRDVLDMWGTLVACYVGTPFSFNKEHDDQAKKLSDQIMQLWKVTNARAQFSALSEPEKNRVFWTAPKVKEWSGANSLRIMADVRTPVKCATGQFMNESTPRPRTVFQRRTQSAMSHPGIKTDSPFKSWARGGNASYVMGGDNSTGFGIQSATFHANNGSKSNLDFESDEEFKREHDLQKLSRQFKEKSSTSCSQTNTTNDQSSAKCSDSVIHTASGLPHLSDSLVATRSSRSSSASSIQSFRTTPENVSEIELMTSIEAEKEQHGDTATELQEVCLELESTKETLQASLTRLSLLEETNAAISKEAKTLKFKLEDATAEYETNKKKIRNDLKPSAAAFAKDREADAKKTAALKSRLQEVTEARNSAVAESSLVAGNNASLQSNIENISMQLKEVKEAYFSSTVDNSRLRDDNKSMSDKIYRFEIQLKQIVEARDAAQQEALSLKDSFHVKYSGYLETLLDQLKISTTETHSPVSEAEKKHLQDRVQDLKDARDTEVQLISHLFREREDLTEQITKLQAQIKGAAEFRSATSSQLAEILNHKNTAVQENAVLAAQLIEVRNFLDFAQKQVLRLEQENIADHLSSQAGTKVEDIQATIQVDQITDNISKEESANDSAVLLLEIDRLKSLLEKEETAHKSYETKLTCSESSLRNVKSQLEKEQSAHLTSTRKLDDLLQRDTAVQTAKVIDLNRGSANKGLVKRFKAKMERPDCAADTSLFLQGALASDDNRSMFQSIYRRNVPNEIRKVTNPVLLMEVTNMRAALRDRSRLSAYIYDVNFHNSDEYDILEQECKMTFQRMMAAAGQNRNSAGPERRAVEDAFDNDPVVRANVQRMTQIFNREMRYFHQTVQNQ
ncbi:hypothetical protein BKA61DRAFT_730083 [Leptodontidium sp. MPI-SDFR-AT-0119]|nr:hypothetical protein BKA61DRAFT_730083 [Leptodontidium sp. MPI-SDFR-AT-0119]